MNLSLENLIGQKMAKAFNSLNLDSAYAAVKVSDRPDLSDFQCNGALALAKQQRQNPREIAAQIAAVLESDSDLAKVSVDGPGFLNLTLTDEFIADLMQKISDEPKGLPKLMSPTRSSWTLVDRMLPKLCTWAICVQGLSARPCNGLNV